MEAGELPIFKYEHEILNSVKDYDFSFIVGLPGSGKSTQVPKFLLPLGIDPQVRIAMTQPKKLAVYNIYSTLSQNLGENLIGFQTGEKAKIPNSMKIKVMSDGIFLREMQSDLSLFSYDYVIIDEIQLRKRNSDIISIILTNIVKYRKSINRPLKVIFLSSTTDIIPIFSSFLDSNSFGVVEVEGRCFKIKNHFCKIDSFDYFSKCAKYIKKIHLGLPQGNILVFVSGKDEIEKITGLMKDENLKNLRLISLYSKIGFQSFKTALGSGESGERICWVSTNVAETSLTLPRIKYVIDCGKVKKKIYEPNSCSFSYDIFWESKESAKQRAGRAGRTEPGHCYYLFSAESYFKNLPEFDKPEISQIPLEETILLLKSFGVPDYQFLLKKLWAFEDLNFYNSLKNLHNLSLLTSKGELSDLGMYCSILPLSFNSNFFIACFINEADEFIYCAILFSFFLEKYPDLLNLSSSKNRFKSDILSILDHIFTNFDLYFSGSILEEFLLILKKCNKILKSNLNISKIFPFTSKILLGKFSKCILFGFRNNLAVKVQGTGTYETIKNGNTIVCRINKYSSFSKNPPPFLIYLNMTMRNSNYFIDYITTLEIE
jgi:HrpA-like RNA helicase